MEKGYNCMNCKKLEKIKNVSDFKSNNLFYYMPIWKGQKWSI